MRLFLALAASALFVTAERARSQPAASLGKPTPAATLGLPVGKAATPLIARGASPDPLVGDYIPAARLGPISEVRFAPDPAPEMTATPEERYNWGIRDRSNPPARLQAAPSNGYSSQQSHSLFGEKVGELFDNGGSAGGGRAPAGERFKSDHCFDDMISPMTNPFLNEDPRALTEIRPIFMYQTIPGGNSVYHGGNIEYFGLQARIALTQRISIVMNKLGGISINPGADSTVGSATGFSEIWLGPKLTWYREDQTGTVSAIGLIFQIPTGPARALQNTGSLSLTPYVNVAQRIANTSWGTFNFMDTLGLNLSTNSVRSNYLYNSAHVDFDLLNWHYVYPLVELNWFQYTSNGSARTVNFEGHDLANLGASASGHSFMSLAFGSRFKVSEAIQFGLAAEFPLLGNRDLQNFRLTVDMIWRY